MSTQVLLISEQKIKSFTDVNENVYVSDLIPGIIATQDLDLQPLLGSKFYDGLKARVLAGTQTVDETLLLDDYISPFLLNQSVWRILPNIKWKLMNKSVLSPSSETANSITLEEFQYLRNDQLNTATFYRERLRNYLWEYRICIQNISTQTLKELFPITQNKVHKLLQCHLQTSLVLPFMVVEVH